MRSERKLKTGLEESFCVAKNVSSCNVEAPSIARPALAGLAAVVVVAELCANDRLTWSANLRRALQDNPQIEDVDTDLQPGGLESDLIVDRDSASRLGNCRSKSGIGASCGFWANRVPGGIDRSPPSTTVRRRQ